MIKRILSFFLMLVALLGAMPLTAIPANAEYALITDRDVVDGSDYTDSSTLADKLNAIFDGDAGIYKDLACTVPVDTTLGTSPVKNNGVYMYVDPVDGMATNIGTSCWIYANGVYYTLFGESTGNGIGENSEKLSLSGTGSRQMSYANFKAWGVRQGVGALVRASGHSMIVLGYDAETLTILDGNSNGRGLVSISVKSWDRVSSYVEYIIQPKEAHYAALYACGMCGDGLSWFVDEAGTLTISGSGQIAYAGWLAHSDRIRKVVIGEGVTGIGSGTFYNCGNLKEIVFDGDAPAIAGSAFLGVTAAVQYPAPKRSWTEDRLQQYGGDLTWIPYGMTELKITAQPEVTFSQENETATVFVGAEGDGLTYAWYVKEADDDMYVKSSVTGAYYSTKTNGKAADRQVMCVIQDQYGNYVKSESVLLRMDPTTEPNENTTGSDVLERNEKYHI